MKVLFSFRETRSFTKQIVELLSDDEFAKFQRLLIQLPESGDIIPGSGGIRKIRFSAKGKGKRGGARVIYYLAVGQEKIFLLDIYTKDEKADLTLPELNDLRKIVEEWLDE
jgi:mRNA-degrading endonuclease RelE of RelBE toxin-antitoxin system